MHIAVIGAGAAGLCAARHSAAAGHQVTVFEQTGVIGGTWVYTDRVGLDEYGMNIHSSMYHGLMSNIPKEIMGYPYFPIPAQERSYIPAADVLAYIELYAETFSLRSLIRFHHQVIRVRPIDSNRWEIIVKDLKQNHYETQTYDAVMVCNGHYSEPSIPEYAGRDVFGGHQLHSHEYRRPDAFKDRKVLIIGAGPSGLDISCAVAEVANSVTMSYRNIQANQKFPEQVLVKPDVKRFTENGADFVDGTEQSFDDVIFCTGYLYAFPFLSVDCGLSVTDGFYVQPLYKQCININHPTMYLIGLLFRTCPFLASDIQTRFCLAHLNGSKRLPGTSEMLSVTDADMLKRWDHYGRKTRYAHMLDIFQEEYYKELAEIGGIEPIKAHVLLIYYAAQRYRIANFKIYRQQRFTIVDDKAFTASVE